jgi:sodium transport system permease protein
VTRAALVVFWKEVTDNLRDRRSVGTALLYAIMGPLVLIPMLGFVGRAFDHGDAKLLVIPLQGAEHAPGLVEYLREKNIETRPAPADPAKAVRDLTHDVVVIIPSTYAEDFRAGRPATVRIVTDHSRSTAAGEIRRVSNALEMYGRTVGALRLIARGVSPRVVSALAIEIDDVATPESEGALLLASVPMFLLMALFVGGVYVAVDVTAGERERGSLEPLMSNPLTATDMVLGKLLAVVFFALAALIVAEVMFALVISVAPFPEIPGMRFTLGVSGSLHVFAALLPLLLPVAALQMLLASRSRTVKEAHTAVMLSMLVPMLPGMFLAFTPFKATTSSMTIPIFAQEVLVNQILRGAPLGAIDYIVAAATATALGIVLAALATMRYRRERALSATS